MEVTVSLETCRLGDIVVVPLVIDKKSPHSSQLSLRAKKIPTPIIETQIRKSEIISRIFLPNLSMMSVVENVPTTWMIPTRRVLRQTSIPVPALWSTTLRHGEDSAQYLEYQGAVGEDVVDARELLKSHKNQDYH